MANIEECISLVNLGFEEVMILLPELVEGHTQYTEGELKALEGLVANMGDWADKVDEITMRAWQQVKSKKRARSSEVYSE